MAPAYQGKITGTKPVAWHKFEPLYQQKMSVCIMRGVLDYQKTLLSMVL